MTVRVEVRGRTLNLKAHLPKAYPALEAPLVLVEGSAASQTNTDFAVRALREQFVPGASKAPEPLHERRAQRTEHKARRAKKRAQIVERMAQSTRCTQATHHVHAC